MEAYQTWLTDPTPDNMGKLLKELDPVITSEITRFPGGGPVLKTKAKTLAIEAIKKYDPAQGTQLKSWVVTQLQPLSRYRQSMAPLKVPEAAARKAAEVDRIRTELTDKLGHQPSDIELADEIGISVKRINQLRDMSHAVVTESSTMAPDPTTDETPPAPSISAPDDMSYATDEVYKGLDARSRFILDATTGRGGKPILPKLQIAARLGVTPAFISQQSAMIAARIQRAHQLLST